MTVRGASSPLGNCEHALFHRQNIRASRMFDSSQQSSEFLQFFCSRPERTHSVSRRFPDRCQALTLFCRFGFHARCSPPVLVTVVRRRTTFWWGNGQGNRRLAPCRSLCRLLLRKRASFRGAKGDVGPPRSMWHLPNGGPAPKAACPTRQSLTPPGSLARENPALRPETDTPRDQPEACRDSHQFLN